MAVQTATKPSLTIKRRIKAPPAKVFAAWTDPEKVKGWMGPGEVKVLKVERESLVTVDIRPDGDGSLLTLTHEQFFDEDARDRHHGGWTGALDKMEKLFA